MAFHPQYADNRRFFVMYNAPPGDHAPEGSVTELHISELRSLQADPNMLDANSERVLPRIPKPQFNHNGGMLAFRPDGYLYISVGDGGGANDTGPGHSPNIGNGQDLSSTLAITDGILLASRDAGDGTWDIRERRVADQPNGRIGRLILGFGEDADGELYVMTTKNLGPVGQTGVVYRIDPAP